MDRVELTDRSLTIGRSALNSVVLHDTAVSRCHCVIELTEGATRILDIGSRDGFRVNRRRRREATLADGDRISIGSYELTYHDDPAPARAVKRAEPSALTERPIAIVLAPRTSIAPGSGSALSSASQANAASAPIAHYTVCSPPDEHGEEPPLRLDADEATRRAGFLAERLDASERAWAEAEAALRAAEVQQREQISAAAQAESMLRAANARLEQDIDRLTAERDRLRRERDALTADLRRARAAEPIDPDEPPAAGPNLVELLRGAHQAPRHGVADRDRGSWLIAAVIAFLAIAAVAAVIVVDRLAR